MSWKTKTQNASGGKTEKQRNGNDKQNVSFEISLQYTISKRLEEVVKPWERSSGWLMTPVVAASSGRCRAVSTAGALVSTSFALTQSAFPARITVLISLRRYLSRVFFSFFKKYYCGFQLNQSCLWLEIMSVFARLQMNTVAPGLLSYNTVTSRGYFWGRREKEKSQPSETN